MSLAISLLLAHSTGAQISSDAKRPSGGQGEAQKETPAQLAELAEANRLNASVVKLYREHKYDDALVDAKLALEAMKRAVGAEDERVAVVLLNYAEVYMAENKFDQAEPPLQQALTIYEKKLGPDNQKVSKILDRLALIQYVKGNNGKAEALYRRAISIREKALGPEHAEVAQSIYGLAEFYQFTGEYKKAEPFYQRLIAIREKTLKPKHPEELAEALERYACLMRKTKRQDEARELEDRAYKLFHSGESIEPPQFFGVVNGHATNLPKPRYPVEARAGHISGVVKVQVLIDESGKVVRACAVEGPGVLMRVSEISAYHAQFTPTLIEKRPVKVTGFITYRFIAR